MEITKMKSWLLSSKRGLHCSCPSEQHDCIVQVHIMNKIRQQKRRTRKDDCLNNSYMTKPSSLIQPKAPVTNKYSIHNYTRLSW